MKLTLFLISVMIIVFAYGLTGTEKFFDTYGFSGANALSRPYVLITSIFIHGGIAHLLSNIFAMFVFSSAVESELGRTRTLAIFIAGAIAGDMFSLLVYPFDAVSVGASGGIFALIGTGILVKPVDLSMYPFIVPMPLALIGMFYAIYNFYGLFFDAGSSISYAGHFGGLLLGFAIGFYIRGFKKSMTIIMLSLLALSSIPVILALLRNALK